LITSNSSDLELAGHWDRDCVKMVEAGRTDWEALLAIFDADLSKIEKRWEEHRDALRRSRPRLGDPVAGTKPATA
jgi:hypothetical protein